MDFKQLTITMLSAVLLLTAGCTRALEVKYRPGFAEDDGLKAKAKERVAIVVFKDERAWVDKADARTLSFVAKQGSWKFGLEYEGVDYVPVSTVIQALFVEDFKAAGYEAFAAKEAAPGAYSISGRIMVFEFENEIGFVTVTARRSVSLALTISGKDGEKLAEDFLFTENDREGEGMGVMHSTNLDKLLHGPFKKVVAQVLNKLQAKVVESGPTELRVTLNGLPLPGGRGLGTDPLRVVSSSRGPSARASA
jgi:hypothetical protein